MSIVVAALLLLQEKTAEETFRVLEEVFEKAKTVSVRIVGEWSSTEEEKEITRHFHGRILLKEGNRASYLWRIKSEMRTEGSDFVSDGRKLGSRPETTIDTPKNLNRNLTYVLSRSGFGSGLFMLGGFLKEGKPERFDFQKSFKVSDFSFGDDAEGSKSLKFDLKCEDWEVGQVTVWYDPKTFKMVRRRIAHRGTGRETTVENFEEFLVNSELSDEKFKLSDPKPTIHAELKEAKGFGTIKDATGIENESEAYTNFIQTLSKRDAEALWDEAHPVDYKLFSKTPSDLRGQVVRLQGMFLQSNPIRLDRAVGDVQWVHRTYFCSPDASEGYVLDLLDPPGDLKKRRTLIAVEGVFFKLATYEGARGDVQAPHLLGRKLRVVGEK